MKLLRQFLLAFAAGVAISLGGAVYLSLIGSYKALGAVLFTVGLFTICTFGFSLFTGKVTRALDNPPSYVLTLAVIWTGNFAGAAAAGGALLLTRFAQPLHEAAQSICAVKLADSPLSIFILAFFCNLLIYIAVEQFRVNPHELGKYLALFLGIAVFILCGFEHCVANMFYFTVAGSFATGRTWLWLLIMTLGNAAGGLMLPALGKLTDRIK